MRYRSRSRNYDSSERYKSRRSPEKYESSKNLKNKAGHSDHSTDNKKAETIKNKKTTEKTRYDHQDSVLEDKATKKNESTLDKDFKCSKSSKHERDESGHEKRPRRTADYTHTYRRNSVSSDISSDSHKYRRNDEKYDQKKSYHKDAKRSKISRSPSSEHEKVKQELKDKKDRKIKKKSKKSEKEKIEKIDKKKKKKRRLSDDEKTPEEKKTESKVSVSKPVKSEPVEELPIGSKAKIKVEPFKVKENTNLKSQMMFLNSSTKELFTKDEWQKEASDDENKRRKELSKIKCPPKEKIDVNLEVKHIKEEKVIKKIKLNEDDIEDKRKRRRDSKSKVVEKSVKSSKEKRVESEKRSSSKFKSNRHERSHSHSKTKSSEHKDKKSRDHKSTNKCNDDRKRSDDYLSEDERLELPRTPTDAQFAGLFTRLPEESVSDTDIEDILPPMLLDDRMSALLDNDPNGAQEAWDSEDDVLLNKRENVIAPKHRGVLETLSVPWKMLIDEASLTNVNAFKNKSMRRYEVSNMLSSIGVSYKLAGEVLLRTISEKYSNVFLSPLPLIHQTLASQKIRRGTIFRERGLFAGALSARKDFFIRRVLFEPTV